MSLLARYRGVLSADGAAAALVLSLVGRLSLGMTGLAILLLVRADTGSYAAAGAVSAAYSVAFAVGSPGRARTADRNGPVGVLRWCGLAHPITLVLLAVLAKASVPTVLLGVVAIGAGLTVPPLGSVMRALWAEIVEGPAVATAYSLESVAVELCFVIGPGLTAAAAALAGPPVAVVLSGVMTLIGGIGLSRNRAVAAVRPHPDRVHAFVGPLSSPAVLALLLTITWVGVGFGAVEIAMPAFAEAHGARPAAAGVLLAIWSLGSITGGLLYGGLAVSRPAHRQLPVLISLFGVASLLPLLAHSGLTMALALFGYGLTIAPFFACNSVLLGSSAPPGTTTEAFAWNASMIFGGAALGTAAGGSLAQAHGPTAAVTVTAIGGLLAVVTSLSGRRRLLRVN